MAAVLDALALTPAEALYGVLVVFAAAVVRGYSGFGLSALLVLSLSLILPPARVVPIALMLEVTASLAILPSVKREVMWGNAGWLLVGGLMGMPFGILLLAHAPAAVMRALISLFVLCACLLLWRGFALARMPGRGGTLAVGTVAGVANGAAAVAGLPVALFYLSAPLAAAASRATMIFYFMILDTYGAGLAWNQGLLGSTEVARAAALVPPLLLGQWFGNRRFRRAAPDSFRRFALGLLMVLALVGLARSLLD